MLFYIDNHARFITTSTLFTDFDNSVVFIINTNSRVTSPNWKEAMNGHDPYEHESYAAMCQRTDAWLVAAADAACYSHSDRSACFEDDEPETVEEEHTVPTKKETATETWKRISQQREAKLVKAAKTAAKKSVTQRKIKKINTHFTRK